MISIRQIIVILILINFSFIRAFGQSPKKRDCYYELADSTAYGTPNYLKVTKIADGQHEFYSKDKKIITKGTFKNGQLVKGHQYFYGDRIVYYENGKYTHWVHAEAIPETTIDSTKVKK